MHTLLIGNDMYDINAENFSLNQIENMAIDSSKMVAHMDAMAKIIKDNHTVNNDSWTIARYNKVVTPLIAYILETNLKQVKNMLGLFKIMKTHTHKPEQIDDDQYAFTEFLGTFRDYKAEEKSRIKWFILEAMRIDNPKLYDILYIDQIFPMLSKLGLVASTRAINENKFWIIPIERMETASTTMKIHTAVKFVEARKKEKETGTSVNNNNVTGYITQLVQLAQIEINRFKPNLTNGMVISPKFKDSELSYINQIESLLQ